MVQANEPKVTTDTISDFLQAIRDSSILSEQQVVKLEARVAGGEQAAEPAELSANLVKSGILTEYQARQIQKGRPQVLTFGSYVILDFLGKGTMGKVYKARHRMMGRVVALKVLDSRYIASPRSLARFQREMQLVGRLDHLNVIRAFDADRIGDCHFIAMEYAEGMTLEAFMLSRGALPPADVVFYAAQTAEGLAHAHARSVLHRDIKPSNLLLIPGKKIKILDFGLGTLLEKDELMPALTTAGYAVGTPDYISPEQARMVKIDGRSDLYSLGCTMYHLLSGRLPFQGESSMDCLVGRITGQAVPISEVMPGLPPRLVETIEKLMATSPDDRYQTADEAAIVLRSMLRPKNAAPSPSAPTAEAVPATPGPPPKEAATPEPPAPPVPVLPGTSQTAPDSARLRPTARGKTAKRALAAVAVAVAVPLVLGAIILFRSSGGEPPASERDSSPTDAVAGVPAGGADAHPSTSVIEDPKPEAAVSKKEDGTPRMVPEVAATARRPRLVIESPTAGAGVGMREELNGRLESEGWPVIFVQADIPGQLWWCQAAVAKVEGGRFTTRVVFGDDFTPSGTKFKIAGIVTRTREEAIKFELGAKDQALPQGFPQSDVVIVTHR
jgi:eukaryotic-like serine/threonine-protein kinase